jgi:hypothetical protein
MGGGAFEVEKHTTRRILMDEIETIETRTQGLNVKIKNLAAEFLHKIA